jgi:hypothetical protein
LVIIFEEGKSGNLFFFRYCRDKRKNFKFGDLSSLVK